VARVGSDAQFFIYGGRALCEGGSEHKITPLFVPPLYYVVAKPEGVTLSTPVQYRLIDETKKTFTELAFDACPMTKRLYDTVFGNEVEHGVTGKGPTVFWGYERSGDANAMMKKLKKINGVFVFSARSAILSGITTL
jgi:4-diphosphocytidyl-2C-methyl-D-erythritol kinase